jgi:hypothetical protein
VRIAPAQHVHRAFAGGAQPALQSDVFGRSELQCAGRVVERRIVREGFGGLAGGARVMLGGTGVVTGQLEVPRRSAEQAPHPGAAVARQPFGGLPMSRPPGVPQHGAVGHLLHQLLLERELANLVARRNRGRVVVDVGRAH